MHSHPSKMEPTGTERYAITFGEVAILHVGGDSIGSVRRESGFSVGELSAIAQKLKSDPRVTVELVDISAVLPPELQLANEAATLVIRKGAELFQPQGANTLLTEQRTIEYDKKYFDRRRPSAPKNKIARYNVVFGDEEVQHSQDYKTFTVRSFKSLPNLNLVRTKLPELFGLRAANLNAEGNLYYHSKAGIGFHGDSERMVVIAVSLGTGALLRYQWRMPGSSAHAGPPVDIALNHGDIYIMSEKATGWDWKMRSKVRVVHAAGAHALAKK